MNKLLPVFCFLLILGCTGMSNTSAPSVQVKKIPCVSHSDCVPSASDCCSFLTGSCENMRAVHISQKASYDQAMGMKCQSHTASCREPYMCEHWRAVCENSVCKIQDNR